MKFGICIDINRIQTAADAGYDYVEMAASSLVPNEDESAFAAVIKKIRKAPLPVEAFNVFLPGAHKVTGPTVDLKAMGNYMDKTLRRASEAGASIMVFGSAGARRMPEGFNDVNRAWEQLADAARLAAEIAAKYGMVIVMEPLFKKGCNFFNRVDQGAALVDRVAHPHLKLLGDLYHITVENEPLSNVAAAGKRLAHIHLPPPAIPATVGDGNAYDFRGFFDALKQAGYDGRVSVEDNPGFLRKAESANPGPAPMAAVLAYLRKMIQS